MININVDKLSCFTDKENSHFILITDDELKNDFHFINPEQYSSTRVIIVDNPDKLDDSFWRSLPDRSHILTILPGIYFTSPKREVLGENKQLAVMACYSTPTDKQAIQHFIIQAENTDSSQQDQMAEDFFTKGSESEYLVFEDRESGKTAQFIHTSDDLEWHEQVGCLRWGSQQLFPSGEISTLPVTVFGQDIDSTFDINGELVLRGIPVLHGGSVSFLANDQARIFNELQDLQHYPVVAKLTKGIVTEWVPMTPGAGKAAEMLSALGAIDSRYQILLELGFGINTNLELLDGNNAMNEVYGQDRGAVHIGFGLIPYTQYHLDIICPQLRVKNHRGETIFA